MPLLFAELFSLRPSEVLFMSKLFSFVSFAEPHVEVFSEPNVEFFI